MASCEPGRRAPYSADLRWCIVRQRIGMELDFRSIADNLNVSVGTVHGIYKLFQETGGVDPKIREYTGIKVDDRATQAILSLICDNPDLYLAEIKEKIQHCTGLDISQSTICRIIHKCGLTRKKMQCIALQRSATYRGDYIAEIVMLM